MAHRPQADPSTFDAANGLCRLSKRGADVAADEFAVASPAYSRDGAKKMRKSWMLPGLILLALAGGSAAADPATTSISQGITSYYPDFARGQGVAGTATVVCKPVPRDALCALYSEDPPGFGFGRAALALLKGHPDDPLFKQLTSGDRVAAMTFRFTPMPNQIVTESIPAPPLEGRDLRYVFLRRPPAVTIITLPHLVKAPTAADLAKAYPLAARREHVGGLATLQCAVDLQGNATDCRVIGDQPAGLGFGEAALELAPKFVFQPVTRDGKPVSGGQIVIPIRFTP